jgi:hypothetical protein
MVSSSVIGIIVLVVLIVGSKGSRGALERELMSRIFVLYKDK